MCCIHSLFSHIYEWQAHILKSILFITLCFFPNFDLSIIYRQGPYQCGKHQRAPEFFFLSYNTFWILEVKRTCKLMVWVLFSPFILLQVLLIWLPIRDIGLHNFPSSVMLLPKLQCGTFVFPLQGTCFLPPYCFFFLWTSHILYLKLKFCDMWQYPTKVNKRYKYYVDIGNCNYNAGYS